jgi:hypothetical protein
MITEELYLYPFSVSSLLSRLSSSGLAGHHSTYHIPEPICRHPNIIPLLGFLFVEVKEVRNDILKNKHGKATVRLI